MKYKQEQAIANKIKEYYNKAKEILSLNSEFLEKLASAFANSAFLSYNEIQNIKKSCNIIEE